MERVLLVATAIVGLMLTLIVMKNYVKISLRKLLHLFSGPIFYLILRDCDFDLKLALAASIVPVSGSLLFLFSKLFKASHILAIIQRGDKTGLSGVIWYGFLWGLWPYSRLVQCEPIVLPALINMTLGDGMSGCAAYLPSRGQPSGKTNVGSALYFLGSCIPMLALGFKLPFTLVVTGIGCLAERVVRSNDNLTIFVVCTLVSALWNALQCPLW